MLDAIDVDSDTAEYDAAAAVEGRLGAAGRPPYSLCEARLSAGEYAWLRKWATRVPPNAFRSISPMLQQAAGLVLLALLAEWNRRDSNGDEVFLGAVDLFGDGDTRRTLFLANGQPHQRLRDRLRDAAVRYELRHAFGRADDATQRWYLTVQLQYGFCRAQLPRVREWLRGQWGTEVVQRLLAPAGPQRSRSFARLMADLGQFRRGNIAHGEARRRVEGTHWVLADWVPDLLDHVRGSAEVPDEDDAEDTDPALIDRMTLEWNWDGPTVRVRPTSPRGNGSSGRYTLFADGRAVADWFLQPGGATYRGGGRAVDLSADRPEVAVRLDDEAGEAVTAQLAVVWDAAAEVQVLRVGHRPSAESARWEVGKDVAVLVRRGFEPSVPPEAWCLTGYGTPHERRWLRYTAAPQSLAVRDADGRPVWEAAAAPPPAWAANATVEAVATTPPPTVGDGVFFRVRAGGGGARVGWVVADGVPLEFDPTTNRAGPLTLHPDAATSGHRVRVGLERNGKVEVRHARVRTACRGLAQRSDGGAWRARPADDTLYTNQARRDLFRLFTEPDGPAVLLEGFEVHGRLDDRPRRLPAVLGTGAPLEVVSGPYNVAEGGRHRLAGGVQDTGLMTGGRWPKKWPGPIGLRLLRPITPGEGHFVLLWSNRHGLHRVGHDGITADPAGTAWEVETPWSDEPDAVAAAVGFDRHRLGFTWFKQWHRFFSAGPHDHPSLTPRQRLAVIRWLRLPGLRCNKQGQPQVQALAHAHPADLLAVSLFDDGLQDLPNGIDLRFDRTPVDRLATDATARQLLLDAPVSPGVADAVEAVFDDRPSGGLFDDQLFVAHPVLASRTALALWAPGRTVNRPRLRANVRQFRLELAGVPETQFRGRTELLLASACRTFSENNRTPADDYFVQQGVVQPATRFVFQNQPLTPGERHNLLVALGAGDFRLFLALTMLRELEGRL